MIFGKMILASLAALALSLGMQNIAKADPIITPVGTAEVGFIIGPGQTMLASFTLDGSFVDVSIAASLISIPTPSQIGTAFLMNQVGAGTTVSHQLASTLFMFSSVSSSTTASFVDLFSGLSLGPGTYYLVFAADTQPGGDISFGSSVTYLTAPGVSVGTPQFAFPPNPYPPASAWMNFDAPGNFFFSVSGTPVPEPSTIILLGGGLVAGVPLWNRRSAVASAFRVRVWHLMSRDGGHEGGRPLPEGC